MSRNPIAGDLASPKHRQRVVSGNAKALAEQEMFYEAEQVRLALAQAHLLNAI
jgi:hypothetical protein